MDQSYINSGLIFFLFAYHKQQKHNPVNLIEQYRNTIKINY